MNHKFELEPSNYNNLNCVKLSCDVPLTKRIIKEPFLNKSFFYLICGSPGSGKSTLMFSLLTTKGKDKIYYKVFKNILYVCPKNSRASVKDNPMDELDADSQFDNLSMGVQDKIIDNKKMYDENKEKHYNQLLIIDDCSAFLKDNDNIKMLNELSMNRRHLNLSIICLVQYLRLVPFSVRCQISCAIIFKPANNEDLDIIRKEFINMNKKDFSLLADYVFKEKHDNMFINKENNSLYKNLQKIIIN